MSRKHKRFEPKGSNLLSSDEPVEQLSDFEWEERARSLLLNRLSRGPRSQMQLAKLLADREIPEHISEHLLSRFAEVGLIDDAAFARAFTRDRRASRGLAKSALKRELQQVGIDQESISQALEDILPEDDIELAARLVSKRWGSVAKLDRDARYRRLAGYLGRRGFSGSAIAEAIRQAEHSS